MPAYIEENFGSVASLISPTNVAAAIRIANDTCFGLGAAFFTKNIALGEKIT